MTKQAAVNHLKRFVALVQSHAFRFPLPGGRFHLVATSPPYWGLRDYGINGQLGHEALHDCLAWAKGLPPCDNCYVCSIRKVGAEVGRVLHPKGMWCLNLADSYAGGKMGRGDADRDARLKNGNVYINDLYKSKGNVIPTGLKQKDLCLIPARVALALQSDGWYVRSEIIWSKPNPMPESVTDRPTKSHEVIWMLTKSPDYYCDMEAVKEPSQDNWGHRGKNHTAKKSRISAGHNIHKVKDTTFATRNLRDVWTIPTYSYSGAHFATWPPDLVEIMVKMGTSERGACPTCGNQWERVIEKGTATPSQANGVLPYTAASATQGKNGTTLHMARENKTVGWQPTCKCPPHDPIPAFVLDPFCGSGTTLEVARKLGRSAIGLDLSMEYLLNCARTRLQLDKLEGRAIKGGGDLEGLPLFEVRG